MNTRRLSATAIGVLYIAGTFAGIMSVVVTNPILNAPDYLARVAADENALITGALLVMTMGLALALIPAVAFPILKERNEALAAGYVVFRGALETITYIGLVIAWMVLLPLSRLAAKADATAGSTHVLAELVIDAGEAIVGLTTIVFPMGAVMFYVVLFQARLIPRWLSAWGLIAAIPYLASGVLALFGFFESNASAETILQMPMALQEMVMALWLIVKGFNPSTEATTSAERLYQPAAA